MFCPKCGFKFDESECNFCPRCGTAVPDKYRNDSEDDGEADNLSSSMSSYLETGKQSSTPNTWDQPSHVVRKKGCGYYLGLCLAFCFSIWVIGSIINYSYSKPESTSSSHRTYTSVTVAQLKDDLNDNALNAANTWKNKYVKVTGILSNIDSDGEYFRLKVKGGFLSTVTCRVDSSVLKKQIAGFSVGAEITVCGKITSVNELSGYTLDVSEIE